MNAIAIVTGANRGLGKETARQLLAQEHTVFVTARSLEAAKQTVRELGSTRAIAAQLDVTDRSTIDRLVETIRADFGRVDILVNNAAVLYDIWQDAIEADLEVVKQAMDTNAYGAWRMVQSLLPLLRCSQQPRIVNVSSGGGAWSSMSGSTPAYSLSKLALNGLTLMLSNQLAGDGILVNGVCPGWVATDMGGNGGRPVEAGAHGIVWAATLPTDGSSGGFFRDGEAICW